MLLDHNQVGYGRTTASIYSVRPLPGAPVSLPLTWQKVESESITPRQFTIKTLPERIAELGDLAERLTLRHKNFPTCNVSAESNAAVSYPTYLGSVDVAPQSSQ